MHAYTLAMRHQLRKTSIEVVEVIPPYVQTDLGASHGTDPRAMCQTAWKWDPLSACKRDPHLRLHLVVRRVF